MFIGGLNFFLFANNIVKLLNYLASHFLIFLFRLYCFKYKGHLFKRDDFQQIEFIFLITVPFGFYVWKACCNFCAFTSTPSQKSPIYIILVGGWSFSLYLIQLVFKNLQEIWKCYWQYLLSKCCRFCFPFYMFIGCFS